MAGGLAVLGSSMHLGHPERAWRAVRGIRTSWLSREVVLIAAFVLLGGATLGGVLPENLRSFGVWTTAVLGVLALFAVDRLYGVALKVQPWNVHSAQVLLGGLFLLGFWGNLPWLAWGAGGLKLLAYGARKVAFHRTGRPLRWGLSGLRVGFGLLMPFVGWDRPEWSVAWVLLGDALDRAEFYDELETDGPDRRLFLAMRQRFER